jgi:hypothetical protein
MDTVAVVNKVLARIRLVLARLPSGHAAAGPFRKLEGLACSARQHLTAEPYFHPSEALSCKVHAPAVL